jgi:hypothetical protein
MDESILERRLREDEENTEKQKTGVFPVLWIQAWYGWRKS